MRKTWLPWLILSPSLLFLLLFTWFPLGRSVYDSLFDTRMANAQYVGLDNFARLFADNVFWQSLGNNLLYILLTVMPGVTLALLPVIRVKQPALARFSPDIAPLFVHFRADDDVTARLYARGYRLRPEFFK